MEDIKDFLDKRVIQYNSHSFIENDPISIPHQFSRKEDIEISGFFTATFSWGNRKSIIKASHRLMNWMDNQPYEFVMYASEKELQPLLKYVYRTFNGTDCHFFIHSIRNIYTNHHGLENVFTKGFQQSRDIKTGIHHFRQVFFSIPFAERSSKHIANPMTGSSAKRLNMFLRWMVRKDTNGVDFGLWKQIPMSNLLIPLDIHSGTIARQLGLLERNQNDWKAVELLTEKLKEFDPMDPVKYDFALFGMGVNKHI